VLAGLLLRLPSPCLVSATKKNEKTRNGRYNRSMALSRASASLEFLLHIVADNIIPHFKASHIAYDALAKAQGNNAQMTAFCANLHQYEALILTCPEVHFMEFDFWRELLFIVARDANVMKQSGWLVVRIRQITYFVHQRNRNIEADITLRNQQGGQLSYLVLESILQKHVSVANAECITAREMFTVLMDMANALEQMNDRARGKKLVLPPGFPEVMSMLDTIAQNNRRRFWTC
jgi:hypothetical protein